MVCVVVIAEHFKQPSNWYDGEKNPTLKTGFRVKIVSDLGATWMIDSFTDRIRQVARHTQLSAILH